MEGPIRPATCRSPHAAPAPLGERKPPLRGPFSGFSFAATLPPDSIDLKFPGGHRAGSAVPIHSGGREDDALPGRAGSAIRWVPEAYLMFTAISR